VLRRPPVEVAGEADHRGDIAGQRVLGDRVEHAAVAVDPDRVVAAAQRVERAGALQLVAGAVRRVEDVAKPEHEARAHRLQDAEARAQLVVDAEREPVDDEDVGVVRGEGVAQRPRAHAHRPGTVEAGRGAAARAVEVGARRRQGQGVGALWQVEQRRLARTRDEQVRRPARLREGVGDRDAAAHMAQPVLVV
jgi:hypothetical protein